MRRLFPLCLLFFIGFARADFSFEDFKKREEVIYPQEYLDMAVFEKIEWLKSTIEKTASPLDLYIFKRSLTFKYYLQNDAERAIILCQESPPLMRDFSYRNVCVEMLRQIKSYQETLASAYQIVEDARAINDIDGLTSALANIGWYQSEAGDVAEALTTYQQILDVIPKSNTFMVQDIMTNMATIYIVHGNREYIEKGISLLSEIKNTSAEKLKEKLSKNDRIDFLDYYLLASFNMGIAYTLHLYEYDKALKNFDDVIAQQADYFSDSVIFAALAASELGQYDLSQKYLGMAQEAKNTKGVREIYLSCYEALAKRHWMPTQNLSSCLSLHPNTTLEVSTDVYKRLSKLKGTPEEIEALRQFYQVYESKIEPEFKNRSSKAASNAELKRLKVESDLKGQILEKERLLKEANLSEQKAHEKLFISVIAVTILIASLIFSQLMGKKKLARQFEKLSLYDPLTKLGNRRLLEQNIIKELSLTERMSTTSEYYSLGIFIFDIDHFKSINDSYGHDAGDEVLVEFSRRINAMVRDSDLLVRWGGEEFVLIARLMNPNEISKIAERIRSAIADKSFKVSSSHQDLKVTCTIGCLKFPFISKLEGKNAWHDLISLADLGLYWGKNKHRDCWVIINNVNLHSQEDVKRVLAERVEESIQENKISVTSNIDNA